MCLLVVVKLRAEQGRMEYQLAELLDEKSSLSSEKSNHKEELNRFANENSCLHREVKEVCSNIHIQHFITTFCQYLCLHIV